MGRITRTLIVAAVACTLMAWGAPLALAAAPPNDDFASATVVGGLPFSDTGTTIEATTSPSDPTAGTWGAHSVWYVFTPSVDVTVRFDTFGSDFDTVLSAFTGSQSSLTEIACDDDTGSLQSKIKWQASAGIEYHVMLNGYDGDTGTFVLHADAEPFFTLEVSISGRGSIDELTGVPTVRGTVTCSIPGLMSHRGLRLHQREGETKVRATFPEPAFECGPDPTPWELSASSQTGPFVRGRARLTHIVWYGGAPPDFIDSDTQTADSQTVRLRR
jgi:hypothetical protein